MIGCLSKSLYHGLIPKVRIGTLSDPDAFLRRRTLVPTVSFEKSWNASLLIVIFVALSDNI
jgi:hypothetical protein